MSKWPLAGSKQAMSPRSFKRLHSTLYKSSFLNRPSTCGVSHSILRSIILIDPLLIAAHIDSFINVIARSPANCPENSRRPSPQRKPKQPANAPRTVEIIATTIPNRAKNNFCSKSSIQSISQSELFLKNTVSIHRVFWCQLSTFSNTSLSPQRTYRNSALDSKSF